jgi:hypothetical protein
MIDKPQPDVTNGLCRIGFFLLATRLVQAARDGSVEPIDPPRWIPQIPRIDTTIQIA